MAKTNEFHVICVYRIWNNFMDFCITLKTDILNINFYDKNNIYIQPKQLHIIPPGNINWLLFQVV